jgi:hypothetical protein
MNRVFTSIANSFAKGVDWFVALPWYFQLIIALVGILIILDIIFKVIASVR